MRPSAVEIARHELGARLTERLGAFWLDGVKSHLDDVMRETNRVRVAKVHRQILYKESWRYDGSDS
jgi:hypothetical protein